MKNELIRKSILWLLIFLLGYGQVLQVAALTLATTPLANTTTSVVRPNLMYVLDDSGSMAWDYTPDYINDATVTDPTNAGNTPAGSSGDTGSATIVGGVITAITATGGNVYEHATPTVLIQGDGTGASATVTLSASKTIQSVTVTSGGSGYTTANTYITFLGGLKTAGWGMCWGTTGSSNQGGTPKDTSSSPACSTRSQAPYSTSKINYQYYDPAVRYLPPLKADGTSYTSASTTAAKTDGFAGTGSTNLTTSYEHEVWCNTASPSPTPSSSNIATHAQCKENADTSSALYPNATYTFRKTYSGPAYYFTMDPSEYCTDSNLTSCITASEALGATPTAFVVGGVTYNVPSYYRWCAYYNSKSKSFGSCQARRDLDHYIPNYLGGWNSSGTTGTQATAALTINATVAGQSLTAVTVGGVDIVGGNTFTSATNGDQSTVASNVCTKIQANTATTGYSCSVSSNTVTIQTAALGTASNGQPVLATGPSDTGAVNSTGEIRVTTATAGLSISSITIHGNQLLSANVTADGDAANTARLICEAINSGAQQGVYIARSGSQAGAAANSYAYGSCNSHADAYVQIKRVPGDDTDNGQAITVTGPASATVNTGSIQINSTSGATSISNVTLNGTSIMSSPPLTIADGTSTTSIATSLAAKLTGNGGCTATASGNLVTITGCTGTLAVSSSSAQATGTIKLTSTTHTYGADLGGITVGGTSLTSGQTLSSSVFTNGTSVSANATAIRTAINNGTGTHGFTAAAPTANGDGSYNIVITAPAGTTYNNQSASFLDGTAVTAGSGVNPQWTFDITGADRDGARIDYIRCNGTDTFSSDAYTGTTSYRTNLETDIESHTNTSNGFDADKTTCTTSGVDDDELKCTFYKASGSSCTPTLTQSGGNLTIKDTSTGSSSTYSGYRYYRFTIDGINNNDEGISAITCGTQNMLSATVSTGKRTPVRINNLTSHLTANGANDYSYSCTTATTSTTSSTCTVTGPVGAAACTTFSYDIDKSSSEGDDEGITLGTITQTNAGSGSTSGVDNLAPYLYSVSAFTGGAPAQGTTITQITSTNVGTIGVTTVAMSNGTAASVQAISTNATGTSPNVLTMSGGTAPDTSSNYWTRVGKLKRVDIVSSTTSYNRASGRTDCAGSTCTYTEELQNFANWYSYYRTRMLMMKSATTLAFSQLDGNYRVGFDNICQATGTTVDNGVAQFDSTNRSSWWTSLTSASPSCATPLRAETAKIGRYFAGKLSSTDPMEYSCQRNYMLLVTDGYWNETDSSSIKGVSNEDIANRDNDLTATSRPYYDGAQSSTTCPTVGATRSAASSCRTLADVAYYFYSTDLRTSALGNSTSTGGIDVATNNVQTSSDDKNQQQHMNFFAMGLGIEGKLAFSSDYETSTTGDFASIKSGSKNWPAVSNLDPTGVDDLWHATVNGRGKYFSARNVPNVVSGLRDALNKIGARVGSAAAAATSNLEPVAGDNYAYVASYTTVDWTGDLQSRSIDTTTGVVSSDTGSDCTIAGTGCQWSAQNKIDNMTWSARRIKIKPSSGTSGDSLRAFTYANLSAAEKAYFSPSTLSQYAALSVSNASDITAENLVNFLRGNKGLEQDGDISHAQIWRYRAHVLGDIVNTQPVYMKAPSASYEDSGYSDFKTSGTAASRKPVVFVSGNDGMLHAINAYASSVTVSGATVEPGEEMWAFIPTEPMQSIKKLADANYTHQYFADGLITVGDVDFGNGTWHTILVGGMGGGGKSYYALDVTDPTDPKYLWEFSTANLGYTFSNVTLSKLPNGEWAVLFTSGYNNNGGGGDGVGYLYALNPQTGAVKTGFPMSTSSGSTVTPSNLGKIAVWADNPSTNNTAQYVYAGDLNGDLWRFDLDYQGTGHSGTEVFKLASFADASSIAQPITTKPELTSMEDGTRVLFVGTGKYLETSDLTSTDINGFYAVKDTLGQPNKGGVAQETWAPLTDTTTVGGASVGAFLVRKLIDTKADGSAITTTIDGATRDARMICNGDSATVTAGGACNNSDSTLMDWAVYGGWYATLPDAGERVNVDPKLVRGSIVFVSNVPSANSCTTGGDAYFNVLDASNGNPVADETLVTTKLKGSLAVGLTVIKLSSGEYKAIVTKSDYQQETLDVPVSASSSGSSSTFGGKKGLWREFEAY